MVNRSINGNIAREKAKKIKLVLTDCDGVLTDGGVYYSDRGEEMKRFNIRDGMGVARLRAFAKVDVGIITGELSKPLKRRAEKLKIDELHLEVKNKKEVLNKIMKHRKLKLEEIAYIGDDTNDVEVMRMVGLSACPADAISFAKEAADYVCRNSGGYGAFRDFAEFIIDAKNRNN